MIAALRLSDQYLFCAAVLPEAPSMLDRLLIVYPLVRLSGGVFSLLLNSSFEFRVNPSPLVGFRLNDGGRLLLCFVNPSISSIAAKRGLGGVPALDLGGVGKFDCSSPAEVFGVDADIADAGGMIALSASAGGGVGETGAGVD